MKRIVLFLSGIFTIFCFLYINMDSKEEFLELEISNEYVGESLQFMVFDFENQILTEKDKKNIVDLAEEFKVTLAKNVSLDENVIEQFLFAYDDKVFNRYSIDKEFNRLSDAVISSEENISTLGSVDTYDNDVKVIKKSFYNKNYNKLNGWYYVFGSNRENFYNELKKCFPNKMEIIESYETNHSDTQYKFSYLGTTNRDKLIRFGFILVSSSFIALLIYFSDNSREISIKKMHGYSTLKIIKSEISYLIIYMIFLDLIISIVMSMCFFNEVNCMHIRFYTSFIYSVILKYLSFFIVILLVVLYIRSMSISELFNRKMISKMLMYCNYIMRICFIFFLTVSISEMLPNLIATINTITTYDGYLEKSNNYVHSVATNGFLTIEQEDKILEVVVDLQQKNKDLIGVSTANYNNSLDIPYRWVDVNYNYLERFPIFSTKGERIENLNQSNMYLLIPECIKNDNLRYDIIKTELKEIFDFEEIVIADDQKVFTFDMNLFEGGLGYVRNAPILISNDFSWFNIYFRNSGETNLGIINNILKEEGIDVAYVYEYVADNAELRLNSLTTKAINDLALVLLYISLLLLLVLHYLVLLFKLNMKEFAIKKIMGFSILDRYIDVLQCSLITYLLNFVIMNFIGVNIQTLFVLAFVLLFELAITLISIYVLESKSINITLKGG